MAASTFTSRRRATTPGHAGRAMRRGRPLASISDPRRLRRRAQARTGAHQIRGGVYTRQTITWGRGFGHGVVPHLVEAFPAKPVLPAASRSPAGALPRQDPGGRVPGVQAGGTPLAAAEASGRSAPATRISTRPGATDLFAAKDPQGFGYAVEAHSQSGRLMEQGRRAARRRVCFWLYYARRTCSGTPGTDGGWW